MLLAIGTLPLSAGADATRGITFFLKQPSAKSFFPVLVVIHDVSPDMGIGWNVTGYPSLENAKRDEMEGAGLLALPILNENFFDCQRFVPLRALNPCRQLVGDRTERKF